MVKTAESDEIFATIDQHARRSFEKYSKTYSNRFQIPAFLLVDTSKWSYTGGLGHFDIFMGSRRRLCIERTISSAVIMSGKLFINFHLSCCVF